MDDLERAGADFADRPELEPTPVGVIRELAHRRRRRARVAATVAIAAAATVTTIVAGAITTTHRTSAGSVFAGGPSTAARAASSVTGPRHAAPTSAPAFSPTTSPAHPTTTPSTSPANSPTTTQPSAPTTPLFTPERTAYVAGGFDVTEFSFMQTQYGIPTAMTLTPGAVWYSTGGRLVRFDASSKSVTQVTRLGVDIGQLTSTPGTVYALARGAKGVDVVAVDANSGAIRWQHNAGRANTMALGPGALWVAQTAPGARGNLLALDQTNGTVRTNVALPHLSDGIVATAAYVWVGGGTSLQRVDIGKQPTVSRFDLGYTFIPLAADATSVWGARLSASQYADQTHLVRLGADDGHPLVDMPYPANSFAMVSGNQAWVTGQYGSIATLDTATAQMIHTGHARTLMSNGPSEIHAQSPNLAWALNTFTGQLVRITPRA